MRCDLLTHGECSCPTRCAAQPEPVTAPVISFTVRDRITAMAFGLVMALLAFGIMSAFNHNERQFQIDRRV